MPPKSQDSTILNAIRLAKTQPVTFGRGLIRTDDNSVLGYVSDLNNMEVDRNGNVRRRKGTVAMNSGKLNDKWYFLESYQIAGVPILFGLSYKRELWAWIDTWPEVDIKVCDKNTYGRFPHYSANSTDPVFNTWVSFSRGSSFHVLKTDRHITIVNNLNDAIRIYSKGCFALAAYKEDVTQVFAKEDIEAVRDNEELELAMYLSIKDVTNKIIEPAITIKTDDTGPLIEGTVQFASINEEGTTGRFTDLQRIEKSSPMFSIFDGIYSGESEIGLKFPKTGTKFAHDGTQDVFLAVTRSSDGNSYVPFYNSWTPSKPIDTNDYIKETLAVAIIKLPKDLPDVGYDYYLCFKNTDSYEPSFKPYISNNTKNVFFSIKNVSTIYPEKKDAQFVPRAISIGDSVICIDKDSKINYPQFTISPDYFEGGTWNKSTKKITLNFDTPAPESIWYKLDENFCNAFKNQKELETEIRVVIPEFPFLHTYTTKMVIFFGYIDIYSKYLAIAYELDEVALEYNSFVFNENVAVIEHKDFNTWDVISIVNGIDASGISIDEKYNLSISNFNNKKTVILNNKDNSVIDFLSNGYRWCVKSGDRIVALSQVGFLNTSKNNILYSIDPSISGIPVNINELPYELKPCYMPVISLNGSTLFSYIDQDKNREVFYDVQYAFNVDDKLLVIQDGAIWVGDTNTLKLTYDKAIQGAVLCADKFYGGLLIGTTDGLYFYNQGQLTNVIDGQAIIAKGIRSGVNGALVIDEYGRPQYITVQINEGGIYGRLLDISQPVSDIVFDGINMIFVDGVFYVAQDDKVFGLTVYREEGGLLAVWGRVYVWEGQKISLIANHNNRLIVAFETGAVKSEVFEQPWDSGIS